MPLSSQVTGWGACNMAEADAAGTAYEAPIITEVSDVMEESTAGSVRTVNSYRILETIGRGSYGTIYRAEKDGVVVAVKEMSRKALGRNVSYGQGSLKPQRTGLESLQREMAIHRTLDHPNIIKLLLIWDQQGEDLVFLVFELADGITLRLDPKAPVPGLPLNVVCSYARDLAAGLAYLHDRLVVHRDIKPENLMVKGGRLKIADFGVSQRLESTQQKLSKQAGTLAFWAPEACTYDGLEFEGPPLDMWAAGITIYSFLAGTLPYSARNPLDLFDEIMDTAYMGPPPQADPPLASVLDGLLARNPSERLTATAMLAMLDELDQ